MKAASAVLAGLLASAAWTTGWSAPSKVSVGPTTAILANGNATTARFPVTRTGDLSYSAAIGFELQEGTAKWGEYYGFGITGQSRQGVVVIPAGQSTGEIEVAITGNRSAFEDRQFKVKLLSAVGIGPAASFTPGPFVETFDHPRVSRSADFDLDGRPDLMVSSEIDRLLTILLNRTTPGAASVMFGRIDIPVPQAIDPFVTGFSVADFNGDGKPDILIQTGSQIANEYLLFNTTEPGDLAPSFMRSFAFLSTFDSGASICDMDLDGLPDFVLLSRDQSSFAVYFNRTERGSTTAKFTSGYAFPAGNPARFSLPFTFGAGDLTNDGRPDVAVQDFPVGSELQESRGLAEPPYLAFTIRKDGTTPNGSILADINRDGVRDIVGSRGLGSPGVVASLVTLSKGTYRLGSSDWIPRNDPGRFMGFYFTGDFNGDHAIDFGFIHPAPIGSRGSFSVASNATPPGSAGIMFTDTSEYENGGDWGPFISANVFDANMDGKPDFVTPVENRVSTFLNTTQDPPARVQFGARKTTSASGASKAVMADFTRDARPDIAAIGPGAPAIVVRRNASHSTDSTARFGTGLEMPSPADVRDIVTADFNNDGLRDIAVLQTTGGTVSVYANRSSQGGDGPAFSAPADTTGLANPEWLVASDFNRDGKPDLAVASTGSASIGILRNAATPSDSNASFAAAQSRTLPMTGGPMCALDANLDGRPDLAVAESAGHRVALQLNTTAPGKKTFAFAAGWTGEGGLQVSDIATDDFDLDGRPDLALTIEGEDRVLLLLNRTAGGGGVSFEPLDVPLAAGAAPSGLAVTDFDGDRKPDLAITESGDRRVRILRNRIGAGESDPFSQMALLTTQASPRSPMTGDVDGDGIPDLAVIDGADRKISVWLNHQYRVGVSTQAAAGTLHYELSRPEAPATLEGSRRPTGAWLYWTPSREAAGYRIYARADGTTTPTAVMDAADSSALVERLVSGKLYYFSVSAFNAIGESARSAERAIVFAYGPAPVVTVIPGDGELNVNWTGVPDSRGYYIYLGAEGQNPLPFWGSGDSGARSAHITGLTNGQRYAVQVHSLFEGSDAPGPLSERVVGTPSNSTFPGRVTSLKAKPSIQFVDLNWHAAPRATAYRIYTRVYTTDPWESLGETSALSYKAGPVLSGTQHAFAVSAVNVFGEGPTEQVLLRTTMGDATNFRLDIDDRIATLRWDAPPDAIRYEVDVFQLDDFVQDTWNLMGSFTEPQYSFRTDFYYGSSRVKFRVRSYSLDGGKSEVETDAYLIGPQPQSLEPAHVFAGGPGFELAVKGQSFTRTTTVYWNGQPRVTRFQSKNEVRADILATDIAVPGVTTITLAADAREGRAYSRVLRFGVDFGTSDFRVRQTSATPVGVAVDDARSRLYFALPAEAPRVPRIGTYEPASNTETGTATAVIGPDLMRMNDDGSYLFTTSAQGVDRYRLPSLEHDALLSAASSWRTMRDLAIAPGSKDKVAVMNPSEGLVVFDGTTRVGIPMGNVGPNIAWTNKPGQAISNSIHDGLIVYQSDASGALAQVAEYKGSDDSVHNQMRYDRATGKAFTGSGLIWDPDTGTKTRIDHGLRAGFLFVLPPIVCPDGAHDRVYYYGQDASQYGSFSFTLLAYRISDRTLVNAAVINGVPGQPREMFRYGDDGLVITTYFPGANDDTADFDIDELTGALLIDGSVVGGQGSMVLRRR